MAVVAQQATAIWSSRFCRSSRARPGRSQIQTRSPTGVGTCPQDQRQAAGAVGDDEFGEAGPDAVPGDQAPGDWLIARRGPA